MADASGPVESSGDTGTVNEFVPPAPPTQQETHANNEEQNSTISFKVPAPSTSRNERKKTDSTSDENDKSTTIPKKNTPVLSPAEQLKQTQISVPYKEPIWGGLPPESEKYSFDVLKNGTVLENVELGKKPWIVFGRLPSCDVFMEHPSLSRYHAVVQYREEAEDGQERGWYLYDLDSTHGTWVNKEKIKTKVYRRLRVGHVVKFGGSSRLYILQGPEEDKEPESELSVTELKEQTAKLKRENEVLKQAEREQEEESERQRQKILELRGCSWGMGEDAEDDTESEVNPFSVSNVVPQHEHLYADDPKKALKGFYEREGCDLPDYQFTEVGFGKHKCIVELPVDGPNGEVLVGEATVSGKKKDAVIACALEACRLLDIHGLLHASKHESRKRKGKNWADDDYYDSDEDTFLDRTGTIEKKRIFRMNKSGKESKAETYDTLLPKYEEVQKRITDIEFKLEQAKAQTAAAASEEDDALEAYMSAIRAGVMDTKTRLALKRELLTLRTEEQRLRKLVNVAKPAEMPELKKLEGGMKKPAMSGVMSAVRKISAVKGPKKPLPLPQTQPVQSSEDNFQEEEEDEEEEEERKTTDIPSPGKPSLPTSTPSPIENTTSSKSTTSKNTASSVSNTASTARKEAKIKTADKHSSKDSPKAPEKFSVLSSIKALASKSDGTRTQDRDKTGESVVKGPTLPGGAGADVDAGVDDVRKTSQNSQGETLLKDKMSSGPCFEAPSEPPMKKKKKMSVAKTRKVDYDNSDPDYAVWMPPQGQSGDGRTSLNDKLGY